MAEVSESKKPKYSKNDLMHMGREDLVNRFLKQQSQVDYLNDKFEKLNEDIIELKDVNVKSNNKINEQNLKEAMLLGKLARKEQEINDLLAQLHDIKQLQMPSSVQLQSCASDPAVNVVIQNLTKELETCKDALKTAQENLEASKFTPDSQLGKRLVEKIRVLQKENEELGRMIKTGSIAKLESELSLKQSVIDSSNYICEGMKSELEEADEMICGLQLVINNLTNELRLSAHDIESLQQELNDVKKQLEKVQAINQSLSEKNVPLKRNEAEVDHKLTNHRSSATCNVKEETRETKGEAEQRLKKLNTNNHTNNNKSNGKQRSSRSISREKVKKAANSSPESHQRHHDEKRMRNYENCNGRNRSRSPKQNDGRSRQGNEHASPRHNEGRNRLTNDIAPRRKSPQSGQFNDQSERGRKRKYDEYEENKISKTRRYDDDRTRDRERDRDRTNKHSDYSGRSGRTAY